ERRQYEAQIAERCLTTGEVQETAARSIRATLAPRVLEHVSHYIMKKEVECVTDDMLLTEMKRKVGKMVNDRVPDVSRLFAGLKMDLNEVDVEARIAGYFMAFDRLVEDNGLTGILGRGLARDEAGRQRMKRRCKLLLSHVTPEMLKVDLTRLVDLTHRDAKINDLVLHDLMIERATRQQQYHLMQSEMKQDAVARAKDAPPTPSRSHSRVTKQQPKPPSIPSGSRGATGPKKPPRDGCLICKGPHWARECPTATVEQKNDVERQLQARRNVPREHVKRVTTDNEPTFRTAMINGVLEVPFCPDTGSDANIIGRPVMEELRELVPGASATAINPPLEVVGAGGNRMLCYEKVKVDLQIVTAAGPLQLSNVECLVLEAPEEELLVGRTTLQSIGVDLDGVFEQLAQQNLDVEEAEADDIPSAHVELLGADEDDEVRVELHRLVDDAVEAGFEPTRTEALRQLVLDFADVFRLRLGRDEPADVQPLEVRLEAGSLPYRSGVRRYPEAQRQFLREYVRELERAGLVARNSKSRWSCPALPVAKQGTGEYRITIDYRPVNRMTVPLAGAAPNLAVVVESVRGAYGFGAFDFHKGFWQMPLHPNSQEMFSFVTEDGVFTPTRVPQGASDSAVHFQAQMNEVLKDLLFRSVLVWIDDVLLYAQSADEFLANLKRFFTILRQQTAPLQEKLEEVMRARGRRKAQLSGATLEWSEEEGAAYTRTLEMVEQSCKLVFPDKGATVCMFSDASLTGYALVLSQVRNWQEGVPVEEQQHELLICRGGLFKGAQRNWSIVEKEGYPIVKACGDLDYMLVREGGFHVYCDHSNLIKLFSPDHEVKQHVKGKLQRWALTLVGCRYVIHHIAGESNLWADIISRWGQPIPNAEESLAVKRVTTRSAQTFSELRPLQDDTFAGPTRSEILRVQLQYREDMPGDAVETEDGVEVGGKLWLPAKAQPLLKRLFVVAHCGPQGHRGVNVMVELLDRRFALERTRQLVVRFVMDRQDQCLLCKHVKGGLVIQRDWTVDRQVSKRNECLHLDYLYLGESYGDAKYVLVLKDELTHFCEFGAPLTWMSDNGSHFKCQVMELLAERLGVNHQFVPVYTPWINGTVERVNRDILQVLRVMLLESRLDTRNWTHLLPIIQANLNHTPVLSLGNCAPVELFTDDYPSKLESYAAQDRREQQRLAAMARYKGAVCNFSEGDYVLWSRVDKRMQGNKLLVRWVGPFQVVKALAHSFLIRHILTGAEYDVHGSRLKFYHDADLEVTAEIREHVSLQGIILEVREVVDHRINGDTGELELLVAWRGLQDIENSWEPAHSIQRDVPTLVAKYAADHGVDELQ
ncbi:hypothetical protein PHMEG_00023512, partial [Phytophthora megakarya]